MKSFLDEEHSIEQILPEEDLRGVPRSYSKALGVKIALFDRHGRMLSLWGAGRLERDARYQKKLEEAVTGIWNKLQPTGRLRKLPSLGKGARLIPLWLDLELAGAAAFVPIRYPVRAGGPDKAARLVGETLQSILRAHYRTLMASQMQLASTEQSYADLERQNTELREAYHRLQALDRLKSDFVANVNHELRTPLTAVLGFTELLQLEMDNLTEDQVESVNQIYEKTNQLIKLVGRVLVFTDSGGERPALQYTRFDPAELIEETVDEHRPPAQRCGVSITVEGLEAAPPQIEADREKIAAVLDNLIENAVKFSPKGSQVEIVVEATDDPDVSGNAFLAMAGSGPNELLLHVIDHGQGFSPEQMEEIFAEFHQLDSSSTRQFGGMGLGLALAKRVVELHGGKILVDSAPGEGAHFVLSLPLGPPAELRTAPRRRILVVEDESFIVHLIGAFLNDQGYQSTNASTCAEAKRRIESEPHDLVLLDVRLPDGSGIDLLEDLRKRGHRASLPVIVITALSDEQTHERARRAGALEILMKPFTRERLIETVRAALA